MTYSRFIFSIISLTLLTSLPFTSNADQSVKFGRYIIHHNTLATDILLPDVARAYKIKRSKNRAMVNVVVQNKTPSGNKGTTAKVTGTASNLNGQLKHLKFRTIKDINVTYYIADFRVTNKEILNFKVKVLPKDAAKSYTLKFQKTFYTD